MKKTLCMIALAAISFGSVFAHGSVITPAKMTTDSTKTDTTKKKVKVKGSKMKTKTKKDTTAKM